MTSILVTGGLGFIGAAYVEHVHDAHPAARILVVDAVNYAADALRLSARVRASPRVHVVECNLRNWSRLLALLRDHGVEDIVHFAAQTHVSRSFDDALGFVEDNIVGTQSLLECARLHGGLRRFVHISTDEVYGDSPESADAVPFSEDAALNPTNPYAASKAAAEIMARAYARCFALPLVVTRGNNVYGPRQHAEKLVPATVARLRAGLRARVEGDGLQRRNFVYVTDAVAAVEAVRLRGALGEVYNVAGGCEHTVLEVMRELAALLCPARALAELVELAPDRLYNDRRYHVDGGKLRELGWAPSVPLGEGLARIVALDARS